MVSPAQFISTILTPGIAWCQAIPGWHIPFDDRARVLLVAIAGQESNWSARGQSGNGPAHGFWQFERLGGVKGVLEHPASAAMARAACIAAGIENAHIVPTWALLATEKGDNLAVAFARLLLRTDPSSLPLIHEMNTARDYYIRNWRPGKPSFDRWRRVYPQAVAAVTGAGG